MRDKERWDIASTLHGVILNPETHPDTVEEIVSLVNRLSRGDRVFRDTWDSLVEVEQEERERMNELDRRLNDYLTRRLGRPITNHVLLKDCFWAEEKRRLVKEIWDNDNELEEQE